MSGELELEVPGWQASRVYHSPVHENPEVAIEMIFISLQCVLKFSYSSRVIASAVRGSRV